MTEITNDTLARWGMHFRRIEQKFKRRNDLCAQVEARKAEYLEFERRTDISLSCENVAGFIELYQYAPEPARRQLVDRYRNMMRELVDGIRLLKQPYRIDYPVAMPAPFY